MTYMYIHYIYIISDRHGPQYSDSQRHTGLGEVKAGKREINGDERKLDFGWQAHKCSMHMFY